MVRLALAALLLVLQACGGDALRLASSYADAVAAARVRQTQVVVHFRLPGRPVSDATDAALPPNLLLRVAPDVVHVRVDAAREPALYVRLCGGTPRHGPGLATCIVEPTCDDEAVAVRLGYVDAEGLQHLLAEAASLRAELRRDAAESDASAKRWLIVADHFARCGRRDRARAGYLAAFAAADAELRRESAGRLARLAVEDGDLAATRTWLVQAGDDAHVGFTRAMLHVAARQARQALPVLRALASGGEGSGSSSGVPRERVLLLLARAHHEAGDDPAALHTLALVEASGAAPEVVAEAARTAAHVRAGDHGHDSLPP